MMSEHETSKDKRTPEHKARRYRESVHSVLTRDALEESMVRWAYTREGPIAGHFITALVGQGAVLPALESVAESMQAYPNIFDDDVAMVQTAWANFQNFGSPGFPISSASDLRDYLTSSIAEVEVDDYEE